MDNIILKVTKILHYINAEYKIDSAHNVNPVSSLIANHAK